MDILYVVMPAYNEAENIEMVVNEWYSVLDGKNEKSRLVVADSGSMDQTHDILLRLQKKFAKLEILSETEKQHGAKVMALYEYAIKNGADYIFQTDSDGQTNPEEFQQFWALREKYDAIIGKRLSRGDGYWRKAVEIILCKILWLYFHVGIPDANAPFRLMRSNLVERYLRKLPANYNLPNVMLTVYFVYFKEKAEFIEISFKPRQKGSNSINLFKITRIGWEALHDFYLLKKKITE